MIILTSIAKPDDLYHHERSHCSLIKGKDEYIVLLLQRYTEALNLQLKMVLNKMHYVLLLNYYLINLQFILA